jgi:hypothetical protein
VPTVITTNLSAGRITGTRLHVEGMASAYTRQQKRPVIIGFVVTDNSTVVSARERRHR